MKRFTGIVLLWCLLLMGAGEGVAQSSKYQGRPGRELLQKARILPKAQAKEALELIEQALIEGLRNDDNDLQAESYQLLGRINEDLNQFDLALENYTKASQFYTKSENDKGYLTSLKSLGDLCTKMGREQKALAYYERYVSFAEKDKRQDNYKQEGKAAVRKPKKQSASSKEASSDREITEFKVAAPESNSSASYQWRTDKKVKVDELDAVKLSMSGILGKQKRYNESMDMLNTVQSGESVAPASATEKDLVVNDLKGYVLEQQNRDDEAITYYKSNVLAAENLNKPIEVARANAKIADIYSEQNKVDQAIELRNKNISIYTKNDDRPGVTYELLELGKLEIQNNSIAPAKEHLRRSAIMARELGLNTIEMDAWKTLSTILEGQNDRGGALEALKQFVKVQERIINRKGEELDSNQSINQGVNKQLQQIELLEKNREIGDKTIEILRKNEELNKQTLRTQLIVIFSLGGILLLISVLGYLMYRNIQQKKIANQLLALKSLRSQMNPHFIFNALNSVNHYIAQKDERSANKYLSEFSRLMRAVLEHSQKDFITLSVETEIMALYLKLEQDRFRDKFEYELTIDPGLQKEALLIPPMLVQPFVENAIWHGLRYKDVKGFLSVQYLLQNNQVLIVVEDDGIGRIRSKELKTENQRKNSSTGIMNISKRVDIINDMFNTGIKVDIFDKENGSGTRVSIRFDQKLE